MTKLEPISFLGDYIAGSFLRTKRPDGTWTNHSPSDLKETTISVEYSYDHVDKACVAAKEAYKSWRKVPYEERKVLLLKLKDVYAAHKEEIALYISRETGKPTWEALTEAQAMIGKIDITINESMKLLETVSIRGVMPGVDGSIHYRSRGVMAVIGPFNFPGHLPNGHIIPALAVGNTIVFKPSELTPAVGQLMAQMFDKAGFPKGVFNLVHGIGETGKRIVTHELVDGVLFTGSYETGLRIKQDTMTHFWKILALEMGGKNGALVWEDADFDKAIYECLTGSFISAGQRCSCTSRIVLHDKIADKFIDRFYQLAKKIKIGHWSESPFMGPLVNATSVEKFIRFQEIAKREGAESLMRGKQLELERAGHYVTPSINLVKEFKKDSVYQQTEIFGPNVAIYRTNDFDHAMQIMNGTSYGLASAIFTKSRQTYEKFRDDIEAGVANWNRSTAGSSSKLPFGGVKKSGNDRTSGHFAVYYCAVPYATHEDTSSYVPGTTMPGLDMT